MIHHFKIAALLVTVMAMMPVLSKAETNTPIPQKRPEKLNVFPAYIKQLMERQKKNNAIDKHEQRPKENTELDTPLPMHKPEKRPDEQNVIIKQQPKTEIQNNNAAIVSFNLKPDQVVLDYDLQTFLSEHAMKILERSDTIKLDIQAFAKMDGGNKNSDVRLSLARALEVRKYLMKQGVSPSRLKISAMGRDETETNSNRIDLIFSKGI